MSLKKIAEACGTSVATVSRVLNSPGYHCKNSELENEIWKYANEFRYIPNSDARNLKKGSAGKAEPMKIDIFFSRDFKLEKDSFFLELYEILREELLTMNCHIGRLFTLPDLPIQADPALYPETNKPPRPLRNQADGLIILGKCSYEVTRYFKTNYQAIVGIDRNPTDFEYDEIFCSGTGAASIAMDRLFSFGHTRIGYVGDCSGEARYIGYYQALMAHKIPLDYSRILPATQTREGGRLAMTHFLEENPSTAKLPTAFFCANDCTALGVLDALKKKRGYRPSIISIDNIQEAALNHPSLTTIAIPSREMAHHAAGMLLDRIHGNHSEIIRLELPCRLILRESCSYL